MATAAPASIRVLSVAQPFAALIVAGIKPVENRSWATPYRGQICVHASQSRRWLTAETRAWLADIADDDLKLADWLADHWPAGRSPKSLSISAIVGRVEVVDCREAEAVRLAELTPWHALDGFAWRLANPARFNTPIPCGGKLNLWKPAVELAEKICAQGETQNGTCR